MLEGSAQWAAARFAFAEPEYRLKSRHDYTFLADQYREWSTGNTFPPRVAPGSRANELSTKIPQPLKPNSGYRAFPFWVFLEQEHTAQLIDFFKTGAPADDESTLATSFKRCFGQPLERLVLDFLVQLVSGGLAAVTVSEFGKEAWLPVKPLMLTPSDVPSLRPEEPWKRRIPSGGFLIAYLDEPVDDARFSTLRARVAPDGITNDALLAVITAAGNVVCAARPVGQTPFVTRVGQGAFVVVAGPQGYQQGEEAFQQTNTAQPWTLEVELRRERQPYQIVEESSGKCLEVDNGTADTVQFYERNDNPWAFWFDDEGGVVRNYHDGRALLAHGPEWLLRVGDPSAVAEPCVRVGWDPAIPSFAGLNRKVRVIAHETSNGAHPVVFLDDTRWERVDLPEPSDAYPYQIWDLLSDQCLEIDDGTAVEVQLYDRSLKAWTYWYDDDDGFIRNWHTKKALAIVTADDWLTTTQTLALVDAPEGTRPEGAVGWQNGSLVSLDGRFRVWSGSSPRRGSHPLIVAHESQGSAFARVRLYQILEASSQRCLENNDGTADEVQLSDRNQNTWAAWYDDDGRTFIRNVHDSRAMHVKDEGNNRWSLELCDAEPATTPAGAVGWIPTTNKLGSREGHRIVASRTGNYDRPDVVPSEGTRWLVQKDRLPASVNPKLKPDL